MTSAFDFPCRLLAAAVVLLHLLAAQSPRVVSMTVYGPLLEPVPNADVTIRSPDWRLVKEGKTDGSGQFFYSGREGEWVYCCATAPGMHTGCAFTPPLTEKNSPVFVDVKLLAAATVRGTVRDESGKAIPDAQVIAAMDRVALKLSQGEPEVATSDAKGAFTLPHALLGELAVRASAAGYELGESQVYVRQDATVDVVLKPGRGRQLVVTVEGVPPERLPDIECRFFANRPYPKPAMTLPPRLVRLRCDDKGRCVVQGLPRDCELSGIRLSAVGMRFHPQSHRVEAGTDGQVTFKLEAITGPRPTAEGVEDSREPAIPADPEPKPKVLTHPTLRGVLRDQDGKPRGLTRLLLYSRTTGWHEAVTAEDGSFAVDAKYENGEQISFDLRNPDWVLAEDDKSTGVSFMGSIWRDYAPGVVHDLVVIAAAKLRGKVTPPRGQSAAGLRVVLEGRRNSQFFMGMGTTDANGAFVIDGLRPTNEPAWLVVQGLRGCAETGPLRLDKRGLEGVELKLDPPLEVTGLVIGKSGKPVPGARVALVAAEEKDGVMPGRDLTLSDAQGRFAFKGMGAGTYTLDVTVRGDEVAVKTKPFGVSDKKRSSDQKVKVPTD